MKVSTLRALKVLPAPYKEGESFYIRIAGKTLACLSLHQAKAHTAYFPQHTPITFSKITA